MLMSYVLRLVTDELNSGQLVGEVESVATGRTGTVHGAEDLLAFCRQDAVTTSSPASFGETR